MFKYLHKFCDCFISHKCMKVLKKVLVDKNYSFFMSSDYLHRLIRSEVLHITGIFRYKKHSSKMHFVLELTTLFKKTTPKAIN